MAEQPGGSGAPMIIEPLDFRSAGRAPKRTVRPARWLMLLLLPPLIVCTAVAAWFIFTASSVQLTFAPDPDRVDLVGPPLRLHFKQNLLLRPGAYEVHADREGYRPLRESIVVARGNRNRFHFDLDELPGLLALRVFGADAPQTPLVGVRVAVDGQPWGAASLDELALERGEHAIRVEHDRYQARETQITIDGLGRRQTASLELRPDWADVEVTTVPENAEVWIDGVAGARTPCGLELLSGPHLLEIKAEGRVTWKQHLEIVAGQRVLLTGIELAPATGALLITTVPAGASVMVDGTHAGASPVELEVEPDRDISIQVSMHGFEPARRTVQVESGGKTAVDLELVPQMGTVRLSVEPPDAQMYVDGVALGGVPPTCTLTAVEHRFEFRKPGFKPEVRTVKPRPDIVRHVVVQLGPIEPQAAGQEDMDPEAEAPHQWIAANGYAFSLIRPGVFQMGSSRREQGRRSNETLRTINLVRPYLMGRREVTNAEFRAFKAGHQSGGSGAAALGGQRQPAVRVSWDDAARFCNWLSVKDGLPPAYLERQGAMHAVVPMTTGYRLPTEAEWEYAARVAPDGGLLKYPWGSTYPPPDGSGNFADESSGGRAGAFIVGYDDGFVVTADVGSFAANHFELYDVGGNVAEWCHDHYFIYSYNPGEAPVDPMGPAQGEYHVVRGAGWRDASISTLRCAYRGYSDAMSDDRGFRICRYPSHAEASHED